MRIPLVVVCALMLPPVLACALFWPPASPPALLARQALGPPTGPYKLTRGEVAAAFQVVRDALHQVSLAPTDTPAELPSIFSDRDPRPVWVTLSPSGGAPLTVYAQEGNLFRSLRRATHEASRALGLPESAAADTPIRLQIAREVSRARPSLLAHGWEPGLHGLKVGEGGSAEWMAPLTPLDEGWLVGEVGFEEAAHLALRRAFPDHVADLLSGQAPLGVFWAWTWEQDREGQRPVPLLRGRRPIEVGEILASRQASPTGLLGRSSPEEARALYPRQLLHLPPPAPDWLGGMDTGVGWPRTREAAHAARVLARARADGLAAPRAELAQCAALGFLARMKQGETWRAGLVDPSPVDAGTAELLEEVWDLTAATGDPCAQPRGE